MNKYCLDTNFFVEAWNKYYSPDFCHDYWTVIDELGKQGIIFVTQFVKDEIEKVDDELKKWFQNKKWLVKPINDKVQQCLKDIYAKNELHFRLVDSTKGRSVADPWVIAHAMAENATVVTKEDKAPDITKKIKIPNVCENMGVNYMNDFDFIREANIVFNCSKK